MIWPLKTLQDSKRCQEAEDGLYDPLAKRQPDRDFAGEGVDVEKGEHQFADEKRRQIGKNTPSWNSKENEEEGEKHEDGVMKKHGSGFSEPV